MSSQRCAHAVQARSNSGMAKPYRPARFASKAPPRPSHRSRLPRRDAARLASIARGSSRRADLVMTPELVGHDAVGVGLPVPALASIARGSSRGGDLVMTHALVGHDAVGAGLPASVDLDADASPLTLHRPRSPRATADTWDRSTRAALPSELARSAPAPGLP